MVIKSVNFLKSSVKLEQMPAGEKPEFAFIGRSNVGKSSLINRLINRKNLAHTSANPGKTQTINHYIVNDKWYLVDLPGYGFAKVSKADRASFKEMMNEYLTKRKNLHCAFVLVDSRIPPQSLDLEMIRFLGKNQVPVCILYTKIDGISQQEKAKNIARFETELKKDWDELPPSIETSSEKNKGMDKVLAVIEAAMAQGRN